MRAARDERLWHLYCSLHCMRFRRRNHKVYKGLIAGSVGGLVASWVMTRFQSVLACAMEGQPDPPEEGRRKCPEVQELLARVKCKILNRDKCDIYQQINDRVAVKARNCLDAFARAFESLLF